MSMYWAFVLCSVMLPAAPTDSAGIVTPEKAAAPANSTSVEAHEQDDRLTKLIAGLGLGVE